MAETLMGTYIEPLPGEPTDETDETDETAPAPVADTTDIPQDALAETTVGSLTETEAFRMYELIGQIDALHAQHARPHQSVYDEANALIDRYQDEELIRYGY